jgi:hypothetical protein
MSEDKETHMITAADLRKHHGQPDPEPLPDTSDWSTEPTVSVAPVRTTPKGFFPASPKSVNYLNRLLAEREHSIVVPENPSQTTISRLITDLLKQPLKVAPKTPVGPAPASSKITATVPLLEGTYTVIFEDASYRTLRIERQSESAKFMPGRLVISYLSGSDNESSYTGFAHALEGDRVIKVWRKHEANGKLIEALRVLAGDPKAAALAYAKESGKCYHCDRKLTTPESVAAGIGPVCSGRGY